MRATVPRQFFHPQQQAGTETVALAGRVYTELADAQCRTVGHLDEISDGKTREVRFRAVDRHQTDALGFVPEIGDADTDILRLPDGAVGFGKGGDENRYTLFDRGKSKQVV